MKLSDARIRSLRPESKPYKVFDGGGLYLEVMPNGSKLWRVKYRFKGKDKRISLGKYPEVSLKEAREKCLEVRKLLAKGIDPSAYRRQSTLHTFGAVAKEWHEARRGGWTEDYAELVWRRLEKDVLPWLKDRPIREITSRELLEVLRRIEDRGALETARRVGQILNQIFVYAVACAYCENNVASNLNKVLKEKKPRHFPAITDPREIAGLLRAIEGYQGDFVVRQALRLLPLVFVRPGELRKAEWKEINFEEALWVIPAHKMKMKRDHLVPLSRQALAILEELKPVTGDSRYVFPSLRSKDRPISENTLNGALRRLGYSKEEMVAHGFRTMASTRLHELGWPTEVIEAQLAHADRNTVRGVYNRAQYLDQRRKMMQAWADYLDGLKAGGKVIAFKERA